MKLIDKTKELEKFPFKNETIKALEIMFTNKQTIEYKCEDYDFIEIEDKDTFIILESKNPKLNSKIIPFSNIIMIQIKI